MSALGGGRVVGETFKAFKALPGWLCTRRGFILPIRLYAGNLFTRIEDYYLRLSLTLSDLRLRNFISFELTI